jgi:hypothetical protein
MGDKFVVFGCGQFINSRNDVQYIKCRDEIDLIKRFIDEWSGNYPDIITRMERKAIRYPAHCQSYQKASW